MSKNIFIASEIGIDLHGVALTMLSLSTDKLNPIKKFNTKIIFSFPVIGCGVAPDGSR